MGQHRHIDIGLLDIREQGVVTSAIQRLEVIPIGGPPAGVFEALRSIAPVIGGLIGVMGPEMSEAAISHVVGLPADVLEGWATTPLPQLRRMMAPLVIAPAGEVINDHVAITGPFREELKLIRVMRSAGLGEAAGYKIDAGISLSGKPEHRFITLALDGGAAFSPRQRELLQVVQPTVAAAVARMAVPLVAAEPILAQVIEEGRIGYLCLSRAHTLVELNERAHELVYRYLRSAGIEPGRGALQRFADKTLIETAGGRPWYLIAPEVGTGAEISSHRLAKAMHQAGEDLTLVMIRETELVPLAAPPVPAEGLTRRQHDIARMLSTTDLSYKEIGIRLGIAEGTVRKHVEKVYRVFGVTSRAGFAMRLR
jgi:DNA-binding CsgD family transcriptional regulator